MASSPNNLGVRRFGGIVDKLGAADDFMLAEYETLRELRQHLVSVGENRVNVFLATVSGAAIALALINQLTSFGKIVHLISGTILVGLTLLGLLTFERMVKRGIVMITYTRGLNRVRRYFVDRHPDIANYLVLPTRDDTPSFRSEGLWPPYTGLAALVAVLNATIAGVDWLVFSNAILKIPTVWAALASFGVSVGTFYLQHYYHSLKRVAAEGSASVVFPGSK